MSNKRDVIIMRGPSGVGKDTWIRHYAHNYVIFSSDDYWWKPVSEYQAKRSRNPVEYRDSEWLEYAFEPMKLGQAHADCQSRFLNHMIRNTANTNSRIVINNTNIHRWEYENYVQMATIAGYQVTIVEFRVETIAQLQAIAQRNKHHVPIEVVAKMCYEFEPDANAIVANLSI